MNISFHPAAEAEFLESAGYYESKVPGLGAALIEEFEALTQCITESPGARQVERNRIFAGFPYPLFIGKRSARFRFSRLPMIGGARNSGSTDSRNSP